MLIVTIELKSARTGNKQTIGEMRISNDGISENPKRGNYTAEVIKKHHSAELRSSPVVRTGTVTNYPRKSYNVWRLIVRSLLSAFPEELPKSKAAAQANHSNQFIHAEAIHTLLLSGFRQIHIPPDRELNSLPEYHFCFYDDKLHYRYKGEVKVTTPKVQ